MNNFLLLALFFVPLSLVNQTFAFKQEKIVFKSMDEYQICQTKDYSGDFCHQALLDWVKDNPKDSFEAGKMTRKKMNSWAAIPFFVEAWKQGLGDCNDKDVKLSVMSALALPANQSAAIAGAIDIALNKCEQQLQADVVTLAKSNDFALKNTCKILVQKKALTGVASQRCQKIN